jgi:DNA modification methylase
MRCPSIGKNGILLGDSAGLLKCLPSKSVDLVIMDPPYGTDYRTNYRKKSSLKGSDGITCDTGACIVPKLNDVMKELDRVVKDDGHVYMFTKWNKIPDFHPIMNRHFPIKNAIVMNKNNWSMGNLTGAYANKYEMILFGHKKNKPLNCIGGTCRHVDVIDVTRVSGNKMVHSHQKPEELIDFLIDKSSKPGDMVIDPFAGSGTTCASAIKKGRRCIGIDIDPGAVKIARSRIRKISN